MEQLLDSKLIPKLRERLIAQGTETDTGQIVEKAIAVIGEAIDTARAGITQRHEAELGKLHKVSGDAQLVTVAKADAYELALMEVDNAVSTMVICLLAEL